MFKLRNRPYLVTLITALLVLLAPNWAAASSKSISYRASIGRDLDGDHIPETATVRQGGFVYKVSINFTSGRPRLQLKVRRAEGAAGLSFQTSDINHDSREDLVISSATSERPVAVWLNRGKAKFQRVSSWTYARLGNYAGPTLHHRGRDYHPGLAETGSADPLAHTVKITYCFDIGLGTERLQHSDRGQLPSDLTFPQVPARGPPLQFIL